MLDPVGTNRRQGRAPASWFDDIKKCSGMTMTEAVRATLDRKRWS